MFVANVHPLEGGYLLFIRSGVLPTSFLKTAYAIFRILQINDQFSFFRQQSAKNATCVLEVCWAHNNLRQRSRLHTWAFSLVLARAYAQLKYLKEIYRSEQPPRLCDWIRARGIAQCWMLNNRSRDLPMITPSPMMSGWIGRVTSPYTINLWIVGPANGINNCFLAKRNK